MPTLTETQMVICVLGAIIAANLLAMALFLLYTKLPTSSLKSAIQSIIYALDKFADDMSNEGKRQYAIKQINDVLGWRRVLIPAVLIGWAIDAEVAAIRKMQAATSAPNLHEEE